MTIFCKLIVSENLIFFSEMGFYEKITCRLFLADTRLQG